MNFASLYNYYEYLVFDYINRQLMQKYTDREEDFFLDVACYSLARLPSRYIRHEIDMVYFLAPGEHAEMEKKVGQTVDSAAIFIGSRMDETARN